MRWIIAVPGILLACLFMMWWLSQPQLLGGRDIPDHKVDLANGEVMFHAGGCGSCHGTVDEGNPDHKRLGGGLELESGVGTFRIPNISSHTEDGIGNWSQLQFVNAMKRGVSPAGNHYYPAFPYASYTRMTIPDLLDLKAYLDTLPAVAGKVAAHSLEFPWSQRWALGLWKRLYLEDSPVANVPRDDPQLQRGRYLVEGPGHCGECHTPRNRLQALEREHWLQGAPNPDGEGRAPDITSSEHGLGSWSRSDIEYYLESGVDPEFDVVGGHMVAVQENLARLVDADRQAITAYLMALPASEAESPD